MDKKVDKKSGSPGFADVDRATAPQALVSYLAGMNAVESIRGYKRHTFDLLNARKGAWLLDIGCGIGDDVYALAEIVGEGGGAVGVDSSRTMIAEASKRAHDFSGRVEFRVGDAHRLELDDQTFDGCRADRTFMHLANPRKALAEMVRVARTDARIVVTEPDWETLVVDAGDKELTRKILNFYCDQVRNGWIGRQLFALFSDAGLAEVNLSANTLLLTDYTMAERMLGVRSAAIQAQNAGVVAPSEGAEWLNSLDQASRQGRFFCALTGFAATGRKL